MKSSGSESNWMKIRAIKLAIRLSPNQKAVYRAVAKMKYIEMLMSIQKLTGLITSIQSLDWDSTNSPPMRFRTLGCIPPSNYSTYPERLHFGSLIEQNIDEKLRFLQDARRGSPMLVRQWRGEGRRWRWQGAAMPRRRRLRGKEREIRDGDEGLSGRERSIGITSVKRRTKHSGPGE